MQRRDTEFCSVGFDNLCMPTGPDHAPISVDIFSAGLRRRRARSLLFIGELRVLRQVLSFYSQREFGNSAGNNTSVGQKPNAHKDSTLDSTGERTV